MTRPKITFINSVIFTIALSISSVGFAGSSNAQGVGQGKGLGKSVGKGIGKGVDKNIDKAIKKNTKQVGIGSSKAPNFKTSDKSIISKFFDSNPFPANRLPPGIQMNLARGKPLPPGINKVFLPDSLASQLPRYPGYEYLVVGNDVLLVNKTNDIIADIITNVIR